MLSEGRILDDGTPDPKPEPRSVHVFDSAVAGVAKFANPKSERPVMRLATTRTGRLSAADGFMYADIDLQTREVSEPGGHIDIPDTAFDAQSFSEIVGAGKPGQIFGVIKDEPLTILTAGKTGPVVYSLDTTEPPNFVRENIYHQVQPEHIVTLDARLLLKLCQNVIAAEAKTMNQKGGPVRIALGLHPTVKPSTGEQHRHITEGVSFQHELYDGRFINGMIMPMVADVRRRDSKPIEFPTGNQRNEPKEDVNA